MRILIICTFFPPLNSIASLRPYSWAKYWALAGHDVTVLTPAKEENPEIGLQVKNTGYSVLEVPLPAFLSSFKRRAAGPQGNEKPKRGLLGRLLDYLRFKKGIFNAARMPDLTDFWVLRAFKRACQEQPWDLVVSSAGPYTVHVVAYLLKKKRRCATWVADYRDTWSNNYIYSGIFPFNLIEDKLERHLLQQADCITTVSAPFAEDFKKKYRSKRVEVIENGFDPDDLRSVSVQPCFAGEAKFRIVHTGSIYLGKRDPSPLFQAIQNMSRSHAGQALLSKLEVIFVGPRQSNLEELIQRYSVGEWVKMHGFVSREKALCMQRDAHALLFLAWNDSTVDGVLTGKIFEYLYSNTPILAIGASHVEASQNLIMEAQAGHILPTVESIESYLKKNLAVCKKEAFPFRADVINRYNRQLLARKMIEVSLP